VEHNLGVDPAAAAAVLAMSPVTLVPLDVTVAMRATARDVDRLIAARPCLDTETRRWLVGQEAAGVPSDERAVVLHDPLALLVCVRDDEAAVSIEARAITVEAGGALVLDEGRVHDVVRSVDASRAVERVLALLEA
jgi:inosine-uridine nucleoside N-ribohydrolase